MPSERRARPQYEKEVTFQSDPVHRENTPHSHTEADSGVCGPISHHQELEQNYAARLTENDTVRYEVNTIYFHFTFKNPQVRPVCRVRISWKLNWVYGDLLDMSEIFHDTSFFFFLTLKKFPKTYQEWRHIFLVLSGLYQPSCDRSGRRKDF